MAAKLLPRFPFVVFAIIEPISLLAGFLASFLDSSFFINSQLPQHYTQPLDLRTHLIAWQLGNVYLLLGILGVFILNTTTEIKVVKAYVWALWLGDIGHIAITVFALGWDDTLAVEKWTTTIWFSVAFTAFLFATRSAYLMGLFGGEGMTVPSNSEIKRMTTRQMRAMTGKGSEMKQELEAKPIDKKKKGKKKS